MRMTPIAKMAPAMNAGVWMQGLSFEEFEFVDGMKVHTAPGGVFLRVESGSSLQMSFSEDGCTERQKPTAL
jgi:hypothetical protein